MEHGTAVSYSPQEPRSDVEWHFVLQTKSRDEKLDPGHLLSQLPVEESWRADPAVRGTRIGRPDRDIAVRVIASLLLTSFSSVLREWVPQGTRGGDAPPAFFFMAIRTIGPGDRTEGCPRSECAIRHERGHPE